MGGAACLIIIEEGNLAYAISEILADKFPDIEFNFLNAAIEASCNGTHHASLYAQAEGDEIPDSFTTPLIDLHKRITTELPMVANLDLPKNEHNARMRKKVNELSDALMDASRHLYALYAPTEFVPQSLQSIRQSLGMAH